MNKAILEKRYGSVLRLDLDAAARGVTQTFFTGAGRYQQPTSEDPTTGNVQNLESEQRVANGDMLVQAVGMYVQPVVNDIDLLNVVQLLQRAMISYGQLGNLQFFQEQEEIVTIMGAEMFDVPLGMEETVTSGAYALQIPRIGKILPLNQPRLLLKDTTFSFQYITWVESSTSLDTAWLYCSAFFLGRFFPGTIDQYPQAAARLGIDLTAVARRR